MLPKLRVKLTGQEHRSTDVNDPYRSLAERASRPTTLLPWLGIMLEALSIQGLADFKRDE
jgi:hypothetical protein